MKSTLQKLLKDNFTLQDHWESLIFDKDGFGLKRINNYGYTFYRELQYTDIDKMIEEVKKNNDDKKVCKYFKPVK